jgi:hypothetical protein
MKIRLSRAAIININHLIHAGVVCHGNCDLEPAKSSNDHIFTGAKPMALIVTG